MSFLKGLKKGLARTHSALIKKIEGVVSRGGVEAEVIEGIEEALITTDIGVETTLAIIEKAKTDLKGKDLYNKETVTGVLRRLISDELKGCERPLEINFSPTVVMVVGINGVGKTTTIGKLGWHFKEEGKNALFAAADTFRAAATEQLEIWGKRIGVDVIKQEMGTDPGAVAFDAVMAAKTRDVDILFVDTAGRLHTKVNLMEELKKVKRVIGKGLEGAPHEVLLVLDATTGQNAIVQARKFHEAVGVTGIALVKLDGTARGGIIVTIVRELNIPIRYVGIGEGLNDLMSFDSKEFVEAMF
ncbi:MAG: signal recognition particle-docking protein FtsY [Thermodesulfobacteriota bacterium]